MTSPLSVMALFCEDIREEKSGAISLMGIMNDNVLIPALPDGVKSATAFVPKLFAYVRVSFDVTAVVPAPILLKLRLPDGNLFDLPMIDEKTISEARETRAKGNPIASVISRVQMGGPLPSLPGRILIEVTIGQQKYIAGCLNIESQEPSTTASPTASPRPS